MLVHSFGRYDLCSITDGAFSFSPGWGTGIALLFLDVNNQYIGHLSSRGLNLLPLGNLENGGNTVIDLSMLSLDGTTVIPTHDPLGNEIIISEKEISILKALGEYYDAIAKNIDADNDGTPDFVNGRHLRLSSTFVFVNCGLWGYNDTPPAVIDPGEMDVKYKLNINTIVHWESNWQVIDGQLSFSGPADYPYGDFNLNYLNYPDGFDIFISRQDNGPLIKGTYTLGLNGDEYTFVYANNNAFTNLALAIPTLHVNSDGFLTSVSFEYSLTDGTVIQPDNLLTNIQLQMTDDNNYMFDVTHYLSPEAPERWLNVETGFDAIIPAAPIYLSSDIKLVNIWYTDLLGNSYALLWNLE